MVAVGRGASHGTPGGAVRAGMRSRTPPRKRRAGKKAAGQTSGSSGVHRFLKADDDRQICFSFNRSADGCAAECPAGRAHICELCKQAHRAVHCPRHPGWKPPGGKGGGKGSKSKDKRHS